MALQPVEVPDLGLGTGDNEIGALAQAGHGQIRFDAALLVEPLGVDELAGRDVDVVGTHAVQRGHGIRALQPELGKGGLIKKADSLPYSLALPGAVLEPVLTAVAVLVCGLGPFRSVPVGSFPAEGLAVTGPRRHQPVVDRRPTHASGGLVLLERIVHRIKQPQALGHPFAQVLAVALERHVAADVDRPQIDRGDAVADPVGHDLADPAGRLEPDGVQPCRDEASLQFG